MSTYKLPAFCFYLHPSAFAAHYTLNQAILPPHAQHIKDLSYREQFKTHLWKNICLSDPNHSLSLSAHHQDDSTRCALNAYVYTTRRHQEYERSKYHLSDMESLFIRYKFYEDARAVSSYYCMDSGKMPRQKALKHEMKAYTGVRDIITTKRLITEPVTGSSVKEKRENHKRQFNDIARTFNDKVLHSILGNQASQEVRDKLLSVREANEYTAKLVDPKTQRFFLIANTHEGPVVIGGVYSEKTACKTLFALETARIIGAYEKDPSSYLLEPHNALHYSKVPAPLIGRLVQN